MCRSVPGMERVGRPSKFANRHASSSATEVRQLVARYATKKNERPNRRTQSFKAVRAPPIKSTHRRATTHTVPTTFEGDRCFRIADIVKLVDTTDGQPYFAQIRGLLVDPFAKKFAALTWLVPTVHAPADGSYDPNTFVVGPEDETLYPLRALEFESKIAPWALKWTPSHALRTQIMNDLDANIKQWQQQQQL